MGRIATTGSVRVGMPVNPASWLGRSVPAARIDIGLAIGPGYLAGRHAARLAR